jgi:hypothetical protein
MPPTPPAPPGKEAIEAPPPFLSPYPDDLSKQLKVTLFPLDITSRHKLTRGQYRTTVEPLLKAGSPLAEWTTAFLDSTFNKVESLTNGVTGDAVGLELHDPLCIWYAMTGHQPGWDLNTEEDIRVETSGQWTRGMCVVDRRNRRRREGAGEGDEEQPGDSGNWLSERTGNRLRRCVKTPGEDLFAPLLLQRIFGA